MFIYVGVKMFFVSKDGNVTTLYQPQSLRALQLSSENSGKQEISVELHVICMRTMNKEKSLL